MPSPQGTCQACGGPTRTTRNLLCWSCWTSRSTLEERFWSKVDTSAGLWSCWLWTGARLPTGYGAFNVGGHRVVTASRFALSIALGRPVGDGLEACHTCDNPPCVNPGHLFEGSPSDNQRDSHAKGRDAARVHPESIVRGERQGNAKLTVDLVLRIRQQRATGALLRELAADYDLAISHVQRIVTGESWAHIEGGS